MADVKDNSMFNGFVDKLICVLETIPSVLRADMKNTFICDCCWKISEISVSTHQPELILTLRKQRNPMVLISLILILPGFQELHSSDGPLYHPPTFLVDPHPEASSEFLLNKLDPNKAFRGKPKKKQPAQFPSVSPRKTLRH